MEDSLISANVALALAHSHLVTKRWSHKEALYFFLWCILIFLARLTQTAIPPSYYPSYRLPCQSSHLFISVSLSFLTHASFCCWERVSPRREWVEAVHLVTLVRSGTSSTLISTNKTCREKFQVQRQVNQGKAICANPTFCSVAWLYGNYWQASFL